ncbi:hypothetical protein Pgy4_39435, partial [Pseudomonas savastanoi pv. glycinea str. race 4]
LVKHHTRLPTLLCLLFFSGLLLPSVSLAANKTVYGLNEYASL